MLHLDILVMIIQVQHRVACLVSIVDTLKLCCIEGDLSFSVFRITRPPVKPHACRPTSMHFIHCACLPSSRCPSRSHLIAQFSSANLTTNCLSGLSMLNSLGALNASKYVSTSRASRGKLGLYQYRIPPLIMVCQ
jgi:hypothetical protein